MMNAIWTFRSTMGLFIYGKWRPLASALINVVVSILLAKVYGLFGVLLGTTITRVTTNVWYDSLVVYKYGLKKTPVTYYIKWAGYLLTVLVDILLVCLVKKLFPLNGIIAIMVYGIFAVIIFMFTLMAIYGRSSEYHYMKNTMHSLLKRISFARRKNP